MKTIHTSENGTVWHLVDVSSAVDRKVGTAGIAVSRRGESRSAGVTVDRFGDTGSAARRFPEDVVDAARCLGLGVLLERETK